MVDFPPLPSTSLVGLNVSLSSSPLRDASIDCGSPILSDPICTSVLELEGHEGPSLQLFSSPIPTFALVDSPGADILPLPHDTGFVTVRKKKVAKGNMRGLKFAIRDKTISSYDVVSDPMSLSPTILSSSSQALKAGAAHDLVPL